MWGAQIYIKAKYTKIFKTNYLKGFKLYVFVCMCVCGLVVLDNLETLETGTHFPSYGSRSLSASGIIHLPSSQLLKSLSFFPFFQILPDVPVFLLDWLTGSLKFLATQPAPVGHSHSVPCCKRVSA